MDALDSQALANMIVEFIKAGNNPALFAGAGVGVRSGLPGWQQLLDHLASVAEKYDTAEAEVIKRRASSGHLLSAAQAYKSCPSIPDGEKYGLLAKPFEDPPHPEKLNALVSIPFSVIFTTNFDRALHHAYSAVFGKDARSVELEDPTMDRAPFDLGFYIARIHGRAEVPESMVLDEGDYDRTQTPSYLDFVSNCLTRYRCLFIGFSFLDPAINRVLNVIRERLAPSFPELHYAILPVDAHSSFITELERFNITPLFYDAGLDHTILWDAIAEASRQFSLKEKREKPKAVIPFTSTQRYLAAVYTRTKMVFELLPLRDVIIDGLIVDLLARSKNGQSEISSISRELKSVLSLSIDQCEVIADRRIRHLAGEGVCRIEDSAIALSIQVDNELDIDMMTLIDGAVNRLLVRHAIDPGPEMVDIIGRVIETTLVARGWDLGACYVGADSTEEIDLHPTIRSVIDSMDIGELSHRKEAISLACLDLFINPDETESEVLARLGRISFALQLILNTPSSVFTHEVLLPEKVFLDSNVLMRAIVDGHPMHPVYVDSLRRLREASEDAGLSVSVVVLPGFLNEIIAHRQNAIREVEELGLEDPVELRHHLIYYGAEWVNVFIAAYASWVGRTAERIGFNEFLNMAANYSDRKSLSKYLRNIGISTYSFKVSSDFIATFGTIHSELRDAYEKDIRSKFDVKEPILIENEARQLARLEMDRKEGIRSIFVSGDMRLQRYCSGPILGQPGELILGSRRFVQLVDLLLGLRTDPGSIARLFWGTTPTDEGLLILNYYTDLALQEYSRRHAMNLPQILLGFVPEVIESAKREGVSLFPGGTIKSKSVRAEFLDRFEDRFYELMAEAIRRMDSG
jgi:predicted nucleic acid-binding protein